MFRQGPIQGAFKLNYGAFSWRRLAMELVKFCHSTSYVLAEVCPYLVRFRMVLLHVFFMFRQEPGGMLLDGMLRCDTEHPALKFMAKDANCELPNSTQ